MSGRSFGRPLLIDDGTKLLMTTPAGGDEAQPEVLIFGQPISPRPEVVCDVVERTQAVELAIATHPGRAPRVPASLVEVPVDGELDVLKPRERSVAVVDAHKRLNAADRRVSEVRCGVAGGGGIEATVGIHDGDDRVVAIGVADQAVQRPVGAVERRRLARSRVRRLAPQHMQIGIGQFAQQLRGPVLGAIVDDDDRAPPQLDRQQADARYRES